MQERQRNIGKFAALAGICAAAFALCLVFLFGLLYLTSLIPISAIRDNIHASAVYMNEEEGDFYFRKENDSRTMIHDYADAVYLNIMYGIDGEELATKIIAAPLYSFGTRESPETQNLLARIEGDLPPNMVYDRYWHGMLIFLRPLMAVTDIAGARTCITVLLCALLLTLCVLLFLRGQRDLAVILLLCAALIRFPMLGQCIEYSPTWLVGLGFAIAAVFMGKTSLRRIAVFFVVCGACTAVFDFLTTETVTVLLPLVVLLCVRSREGTVQTFREGLRLCLLAGILWLLAYAAASVTKWILAELVLGGGRISTAWHQALARQSGETGDIPAALQPVHAIALNLWTLFAAGSSLRYMTILAMFAGSLILIAAIVYLFRKEWPDWALSLLFFLLAFVPLLRMAVMNNHSLRHAFFVHRALFSTVLCLLLGTWRSIDFDLFRGGRGRKPAQKKGKKR